MAVLDEQADEVGAVGVAQRGDVVHVAVGARRQPVEVGVEIAALVVVRRTRIHEPQPRRDAAVRVHQVRRVHRLLRLRADRSTRRGRRLVAVDDHHVDRRRRVRLGDEPVRQAALRQLLADQTAGRRHDRRRRHQLRRARMVLGKRRRIDFLQQRQAVGRRLQLVARARSATAQVDHPAHLAVDDGDQRETVRVVLELAVPRVVAVGATLETLGRQRHRLGVEQLDVKVRRRRLLLVDELPHVERHRLLPRHARRRRTCAQRIARLLRRRRLQQQPLRANLRVRRLRQRERRRDEQRDGQPMGEAGTLRNANGHPSFARGPTLLRDRVHRHPP